MMIELACVTATIDAPAAAIWEVLIDFGHPQRLAPTILAADLRGSGVGAVRIVRSARGLVIHEQLIEADRAAGRFGYAILPDGDMPFPGVTSYRCTVTLEPLGAARTAVTWRSEGAAEGPVAPIRTFLTALYANAIARIAGETHG